MTDQTLFAGVSATWWGAIGSVAAAIATVVAVWTSVNGARRARREEKVARAQANAAQEGERAAEARAVAAEQEFRRQQGEYEHQRDRERNQADRDAEAARLFERHAVHLEYYGAWIKPGTINTNAVLQVTVDNKSQIPFLDVTVEFHAKSTRYEQEESWHEIFSTPSLGGVHVETPQKEIVGRTDTPLPPIRVTYTDDGRNRWLVDADDSVTLLAPRTIRAG